MTMGWAALPGCADAPAALRRDALHGAGTIAFIRHDYGRAERFWRTCLELSEYLKDENGLLRAQGNLGNVAVAVEDFPRARALFETCLEAYRRQRNETGIARALANLARVLHEESDYLQACPLQEESLALFRSQNDEHNIILGLNNLSSTLIYLKRYQDAHVALAEAIDLSQNQQNLRHLAHSLVHCVLLAVNEDDAERSAVLMGADETLRAKIEFPLPMKTQIEYQHARIRVMEQLGQDTFTAMWNTGAQTGIPEICRYAKGKHHRPSD